MALITRKGKRSTAPTSLKTASNVNPRIRNGRRINQIMGKRNNITIAMGQQSTNKMHHRIIAISVLISVTVHYFQMVMQTAYQLAKPQF